MQNGKHQRISLQDSGRTPQAECDSHLHPERRQSLLSSIAQERPFRELWLNFVPSSLCGLFRLLYLEKDLHSSEFEDEDPPMASFNLIYLFLTR